MYDKENAPGSELITNVAGIKGPSATAELGEDIGSYSIELNGLEDHGIKELIEYVDGLRENSDELRNIYKINGKNSNGEFIFEEKPLNKNSIEYFNALKEISKNYDIILLLIAIKDKIEIGKGNIDDFILSGALSIKFLLILQEKGLLESPELFEYGITKMGVKESDVIKAYKNNQINKKQAYKIYKAMPEDMRNVTGKKKD